MHNLFQRRHHMSLVGQIKRRLFVSISLLVMALLFNFLVGNYVSTRQAGLGNQQSALQVDQNGILIAMLNQETGLRGYITTNSPAFLEPFYSGRPQYLLSVQRLQEQARGVLAPDFSATRTALVQVEARANAWYSTYALVQIARIQTGNLVTARSLSTVSVGKGLFDAFRASVVQLQQTSDHELNAIQVRVQAFNLFVLLCAAILSAIAIVIVGYTFLRFVAVLRKDLILLKTASNELGSGELSAGVQKLAYKELNELGQTFNTMAEGIQQRQAVLQMQHDELKSVNADLEEANRVRSQFLSTMSHELRTPLASIIGFSQMLLGDAATTGLNQRQSNNLERILKNGQHLLSLINDVLDMAKIEAGRMVVTYSQVDVRELLTSVVEEIQSIALARDLVLSVEVEEGGDSLESNPEKLRQILINLVSNALKFTEQGKVTVSARHVISSDGETDLLALAVHDRGIGIPADVQEHIFEPFYQVDGSYTRKVGGTGLGLSIVSQLTTLLGGTIEVTSAPGQGSTFTVLLPIKAVAHYVEQNIPRLQTLQQAGVSKRLPAIEESTHELLDDASTVAVPREGIERQNKLVLAVDDNPDVLLLIEAALRNTPYTALGVQDSSQVLRLVQELHPCAVILDVMMPQVNGWQLLHYFKEDPSTASIPIVMLTVLSEPITGYVLGADAYLIKPFQTEVLLTTLQHVITAQQDLVQASKRETQAV